MPDRAERRSVLIRDLLGAFTHDNRPLTAESVADVQRVAQQTSRHLFLFHEESSNAMVDTVSRGWPSPDDAAVRRCAGGVRSVHRVDGVAVVQLASLEPIRLSEPYLLAAIDHAEGAERLVLDLRGNGGGDPGVVELLCRWLLGPGVPISTVHRGDGFPDDVWRTRTLPNLRSHFAGPVDVLVDSSTFSSAEALVYHLHVRGRVRVFGEPTKGGGDHVTPIQLTPTVLGILPCAVVEDAETATNWEGIGVPIDVAAAGESALDIVLAD